MQQNVHISRSVIATIIFFILIPCNKLPKRHFKMYDLLLPLSVFGVSFTTPEDKDILLIHRIFCYNFLYHSFQNTRAERQYIIYKLNAWEDVDQEQEDGHQEGGPERCDVDNEVSIITYFIKRHPPPPLMELFSLFFISKIHWEGFKTVVLDKKNCFFL